MLRTRKVQLENQAVTQKIQDKYPYALFGIDIAIDKAIRVGDLHTLKLIAATKYGSHIALSADKALRYDQIDVLKYILILRGGELSLREKAVLGMPLPKLNYHSAGEIIRLLLRHRDYYRAIDLIFKHGNYKYISHFLNDSTRLQMIFPYLEKIDDPDIFKAFTKVIACIDASIPITDWNRSHDYLLEYCTSKKLIDHLGLTQFYVNMRNIFYMGDYTGIWMLQDKRWENQWLSAIDSMNNHMEAFMAIHLKEATLPESLIAVLLHHNGPTIPNILDTSNTDWKTVWNIFIHDLKDHEDIGEVLNFLTAKYVDVPYLTERAKSSLAIASWLIDNGHAIPVLLLEQSIRDNSVWNYMKYLILYEIRPWTPIGRELATVFTEKKNYYNTADIDKILAILDKHTLSYPVRKISNYVSPSTDEKKLSTIPFIKRIDHKYMGEYRIFFYDELRNAMLYPIVE